MASSSTNATPTSMARPHVQNLLHILRRANTHYSQLAASIRASLKPTHHARKRAHALRLSVSIQAAAKLDQKQISTVPLPILELVATPLMVSDASSNRSVVAPIPRRASEAPLRDQRVVVERVGRPVLQCMIPTQPIVTEIETSVSSASVYSTVWLNTPSSLVVPNQDVLCSRWSATTSGGDAIIVEDYEEGFEEGQGQDAGIVYSSDYDESMDLPVSADSLYGSDDCAFESLRPRVSVTGVARGRVSCPAQGLLQVPLPAHVYKRKSAKVSKLPPRLDVPVDTGRLSWGSDISGGLSSGWMSSASSNGPMTPATDDNLTTLKICIKRKSHASDVDEEDGNNLEKRPKYDRKAWVTPATRRTVQRTASTRKF